MKHYDLIDAKEKKNTFFCSLHVCFGVLPLDIKESMDLWKFDDCNDFDDTDFVDFSSPFLSASSSEASADRNNISY